MIRNGFNFLDSGLFLNDNNFRGGLFNFIFCIFLLDDSFSGIDYFGTVNCAYGSRFSLYNRLNFDFRNGMTSDAFVFDLSDVTRVSVDFVVDDLFASVGEDDAVRASYDLSITRLGMTKIVVRRLIFDGVGKTVRSRWLNND